MLVLVSGREGPFDRFQILELKCGNFGEFLEPIWTVHDCVGAVWGVCIIIYIINYVLVYRLLEIKL